MTDTTNPKTETETETETETDADAKPLAAVYRDRNLLALAFIRAYRNAHAARLHPNRDLTPYPPHGWWPDDECAESERWAVVWITTEYGQVGWHLPRERIPAWLPKRDPEYDGYSTETKNQRVAAYAGVQTPTPTDGGED